MERGTAEEDGLISCSTETDVSRVGSNAEAILYFIGRQFLELIKVKMGESTLKWLLLVCRQLRIRMYFPGVALKRPFSTSEIYPGISEVYRDGVAPSLQ